MRLIRAKDYQDVSRKAANIIAAQIQLKPDCVLGLATGSSPVGTYKELIAKYESGDLDFSQVKTVNLDEYVGLTKENLGLDELTRAIAALFPADAPADGALLTNARQADAVSRALSAVTDAHDALQSGMTPDAVLTDCEAALEALGELNGKHIRDDLVDTIFSRFCVGK